MNGKKDLDRDNPLVLDLDPSDYMPNISWRAVGVCVAAVAITLVATEEPVRDLSYDVGLELLEGLAAVGENG